MPPVSLFGAPDEPQKTNWVLIIVLCGIGALAYYLYYHLRQPIRIKITCVDARISGDFELTEDETTTRKHFADGKLTEPSGDWSAQVWKHTSKPCWITDHHSDDSGAHYWSVGPWTSTEGMHPHLGRYGYIWVPKNDMDTKVAAHKKKQTFGVDVGRTLNPLQSWDVLRFGNIHNGWDNVNWPKDSKSGVVSAA